MELPMLIGLLLVWYQIFRVEGTGTIEMDLIRFSNPTSKLDDGHCCDGYPSICTGQCDHRFRLCLTEKNSECFLKQNVIDGPLNSDVIDSFPESQVLFEFNVWKSTFEIRVNVTDIDSGMEQNVDTYVLNLTDVDVAYNRSVALLQAPRRQISGRRSLNATLLELRVTAFCDVNYYGANCSVFCLGEDSCRGHYTCGSDGHKSCLPGWKGDDCNSAIPGGVADCGYGKSQYPGRWSGSLSCNTLNESVEISIKSVSNTSSVSGTVKLEDGAYDVVGTWLGSSLLLLPASGPWVTQSPRDISKMSFNINHVGTSFTGQVFETPQPCGHISLTQTSVGISRCQNGATCIRDDASGANICCCAPGFKGDNCEIRLAVPMTRSTTTTLSETSSQRVSSTSMVTSTEAYTSPTNQTTVFTTLPESSTMGAPSSTEPASSPVSTPSTIGSTVFLNVTIETENTTFESQQTTAPVSESSTIQTTQPVQSTTTSEMLSTVNELQSSTEAESHTTTNQMPLSSTTVIRETTTSNQNPKTTTNPMPEATSTGMPEETTSEELETTSNALSEATTTVLQETTTEELTKSSTIEQETSTTENPLTSTEAETPASTTAGRLTTPPEIAPVSTTPTTPVQQIVHDVNMTYSIVLPGVQDDVNETSITHAIADAYEAMNPNLTRSDINMTFSAREGIGEDRAFVVEFSYTLSITSSTVFYKPSMEILRRHILQVYTPGLYEMKVLFYLQNHFQVLLTGTPPSVFQYSSIESVLEFAWKRNRITIPTIEEVVGADGIAVSKVYYFIHYNGMVQTPGEGGWVAELTGIQEVFQEYNLTLRVYQDKVLPSYRHHYMYSLAFESYVYQDSFFKIASQIQQTWMNESLDLASCNCLNVTVVRGDQCITSTGKQVTKIIYFTTISGKLQSPLLHTGPTHEALATGVKIRNPKTKTLYVLLKTSSLTLYKYEQKLAFYVKDVVDTSAITTFVQRLQVAWRTQLNVNEEISVVVPRVTGCIGKTDSGSQWVVGQEVSRLDYYLLYKGEIINPHWNKPVQQTEIIKYVLNVTSTSGHVYQAYTVTKEEIYTREQHHVIHLNGHVVIEEMSDVTTLISKTWFTVYQSAVSVSIGFVEEFCATSNRELVTGIFYTLKVNGRIVDASVEYDKVFNSSHLSILLRTSSYRYTVYMGTLTTLISYRYQLSVYFAQTIAELDYAQIAVKLEEGWKTLHAEVTSVKVFVARVEQFYTEEMSVVYRLAYFVRQSGEAVYPLHLPQIPHHRWVSCGCLSVAGISGSAYKLYAGSVVDTASWIPASFHFSLYFQKQVSTLDYVKLEQTIQAAWALRHGNVTVKIVAQEEYVTVSGQSAWKVTYFVSKSTSFVFSYESILPAFNMRPLDVNRVDLSFVNVFDAHYHLSSVSADVMTSASYAFSFYSNNVISEINTGNFTTAIREVVCRQVTVIPKCEDITPVIIRQEGQFLDKRWETRVDYYLRYKGKIVNSASWPKLNTTSLQEYVRDELNLTTESGLRYVITPSLPAGSLDYRYHFSLFMKTKVAYADFTKFASSIKETWLSAHSEYRGCGCIKVSVSNTEELLSEGGERYWKLVYYMNVNGTVVSPGDTQPLNLSLLNQHVTFTGPQGAYVIVPENFYSFRAYDFRYSNALYLHTWVSKEDYHRFEKTLTEYYLTRLSGSHTEADIHVTVNGIRQTTTPDGRLVWKLVYFVNVKNKLVYPEYLPSVSYSSLSSRISFKTPTGLSYKLFSGNVKHLWPATSFFRFYLNHPIAPDIWGRLRHSILQAYYTQYPDFRDCGCIQVEFPKHQDELITETGESVWRVGYRIKLNGALVDAETTPLTAIHYLQDKLTFSGPNGIKYKVTENVKKSMMAQSAFSVFLNHYVSQESLEAVGMSIKKTWATVNGGLDIDKLKVTFIRQKEYTDTEGNPRWKFEYSLNYNNTVIHSGDWQKINVTVLHENLVGVKTPNGEGFSAVSQDVSVIEYRQQFTLFATTKVATESFAELESQLIEAWEEKNEAWKACSCVEIANIRQEEVLDSRGQSVWKMVYTIKVNGTTVDATMVDNLSERFLKAHLVLEGPRKQYQFYTMDSITQLSYTRYGYSFAFHLTNKLDAESIAFVQTELTQMIAGKQSAMEANITVSIERQEEYLDATGRTVWKVVCFAKQDNHYLPASALPVLNYTDLSIKLDALRGPRGQLFTVVSGTSLLQYRYHFSVYLTSRVSVQQYSRFETALVQVWEETKEDYKNCSCVRVDIVNQEEVVDAKGVSYWKLVYYLHVNKTLVESLTSVDINQTLLTQYVSTILRPTGQSYQTVTVEEQSVIRSMFTQAIFLRTEVGLFDINTVSSAIKSYWQSVYEEWFTCDCLDVNFSRQQSYLVLKDEKWITVWRLEYVILVDQTLVDRETIHVINDTMLQQIFSAMTSISGDVYQAEEVTSDVLVEYRWHFPLYVSREVKVTDFIHFEEAVEAVWSSSIYIEEHSVTITNQEEFVDKHGKSLWKLVVFIRNDTTYLDSSVCSPINATKVVAKLAEMNVTGARGSYDVISVDRSVVLHRYDVMIPVFLNIHVYTEDIVRIRRVLVATWELVYQEFYKDFVLDVEIIRQEDFISVKGGDVAKLVYILKSNGTIQSSTRLPQLNTTDIQAKLQTDLRTARYSVVTDVTTLVAYEQHFQLTLTQPLLQADRMIIQSQLEEAWMLSKNVSRSDVSVTITSQEELTAVENHKSLSLWRVLYLVKYKGKVTSAVVETDITNSSLYESLNVTRNDTREKYVDSLYTGDTLSYTIYRHLFAVHCEQKIAVESYDSIASGIVSAWKNVTNKSVEVEIIGQEKIYSARRYVWKLSYSVTYESDIVRSDTTRGPDVETFQQHLKISSLFGQSYKLVKVTNERRVSYALSIFLDKRIMLTFQDMFLGTLKAVWTKTHGIASTDTDIEFQGYERFLDEHKVSVWRHVCFVRVNGEVVNSAEFTQLDMREVQEALDTTFESRSMYRVLDTVVQSSYRDYSLQYSVYFRGRPGRLLLRELTTALLVAWIGKYSHTAGPEELFKPEVTDRKEAVAVNGMTLTQVTYFMTLGERPRDPLTIPAPSAQDIARDVNSTLGAQAYTGDISLIHEYSFLFSVDLRGLPIYLDSIEISKSLSEIYTMAHFVDVSVDILKMERYSGSFGVPVTKVLYTVRGNDTILDPGLITNSLGSLITVQSPQQQWRMYLGDVYRLEVIYSLTVTMELRKTDKTMIEAAIARAFVDNRTSSCSSCVTSVSIVHGQAYVTDNGVRLTRISYTVSIDNEELQSWRDVQPSQEVLQQYLTQSDRRFEMWTASAIPVDTLYIVSSANATLDVVKPILSLAWMSVLNGSVVINATEDRSYVDEDWVGLVRVDYTVSLDSAVAKNDNSAELTAAHLRFLLQLKTLQMSRGTSRKLRRMYVKGKRSELTEDKLHQAVVLSWLQHNPDLNKTDLGVAIKPESKRQKRAATNSLKLVDKDGSYVTAVLYTVSVNGEEPQGLFVEAPAPETIDSHLKNQTGAGLCNCTPSLSHNLTVAGNLSDKDKGALEEALKDAFVAANPGLKKDDLDVQITNTKAKKDENGNMVTDVEYTVSYNGGYPVEDLVSPTEEQTENSLKKHGLNVPDKTKKETTGSNDNWKIIVGVVVGIAGFVVLCSAVAYIYIKRRRRKAESLQKREDGIRQNEFDKEHFSEPVNFNNPSFDNNRHPLDPFSTRSV